MASVRTRDPIRSSTTSVDGVERVGEILKPYVPRLAVEWLRDTPDATHRVLEGSLGVLEGSLAFVDISGFTALTEQLAKKGKIGAELMRDTLDGVFRALLDDAYDYGAGLLKWGGDALLLMLGTATGGPPPRSDTRPLGGHPRG